MNAGEPRFVVLLHDHPLPHLDLLLEHGDTCRTWRLPLESWSDANGPKLNEAIDATPLPNHRLHYLTYSGPVSNGRGMVTRIATGTYRALNPCSGGSRDEWFELNVSDSTRPLFLYIDLHSEAADRMRFSNRIAGTKDESLS